MLFSSLSMALMGLSLALPTGGPSVVEPAADAATPSAQMMLIRDGDEESGVNRHNNARRWGDWDERYGYGPYYAPGGRLYGYDGYYDPGPHFGLGLTPYPYHYGPSFGIYVDP